MVKDLERELRGDGRGWGRGLRRDKKGVCVSVVWARLLSLL